MARSLNKVTLIGNLTREPELRYTPSGTAVATFTVATNRSWRTESGDQKEDAEFHRIVAWDKLAEICSQLLKKGSKVYVEGRLQTRKWQTKEGSDRYTTEIVISEMMLLDRAGDNGSSSSSQGDDMDIPDNFEEEESKSAEKSKGSSKPKKDDKDKKEEEEVDDIPF